MDDQKIIELFFARREQAIDELNQKHGKALNKVAYNILSNLQDAEECVSDGYLAVWNNIPPARPNPLLTYVCKIVRNISLKRYFTNTAQKRNSNLSVAFDEIAAVIPSNNSVEDTVETKELAKIIDSFLTDLTLQNRVIFVRRYWFCDAIGDISKRTGLSPKAVSVRLVRIRQKLKQNLEENGVYL